MHQSPRDSQLDGANQLSEKQRERIRRFVTRADGDGDGTLDPSEFAAAVRALAQEGDASAGGSDRGSMRAFCTPRNIWLAFITSFFEIGTSFCLPAMGALSSRMQARFETNDAGIGALVGYYYAGSMIGPLIGGQLLNRIGPAKTIVIANVIVTIGAFLQATANGPSQMPVLAAARVIIGFGGLITPFCTIEVLNRLFPDHFMFMAGFRNLVQSASGFGAFAILPLVAEGAATESEGTAAALWFCFGCAVASLVSNLIVWQLHLRQDGGAASVTAAELDASRQALASKLRALARAVRPRAPGKLADWKLPLSFYLACYGIQAQYFSVFAFTAFSVKIYSTKFGMSVEQAASVSGIMNLFGGVLGPPSGVFSDWLGYRAASLSAFGSFTVMGFALLALGPATPATVWVATVLFALTYGFGDTVAYPNIRLLVGVERAGIGYGIFSFVGGLFAVLVPIFGGMILEAESSAAASDAGEYTCWYFLVLAALAMAVWWAVHVMEGNNSAIELPASEQVELTDRQIEAAGLAGIAASGRRSSGDIGGAAAGEVQIAMSSRARDGEKSSV